MIKRLTSFSFTIFFILNFSLGLIGPVLSFTSLTEQLQYSYKQALTYSIATFFADFFSIIIVSYIFFYLSKKCEYKYWLLIYTFSYTVIWISDIFDINQSLRFLSSLGLFFSIFTLYYLLGKLNLEKRKKVIFIIIHILFYFLDAVVSEIIATNPFLKEILTKLTTYIVLC